MRNGVLKQNVSLAFCVTWVVNDAFPNNPNPPFLEHPLPFLSIHSHSREKSWFALLTIFWLLEHRNVCKIYIYAHPLPVTPFFKKRSCLPDAYQIIPFLFPQALFLLPPLLPRPLPPSKAHLGLRKRRNFFNLTAY